MSSNENQKRSFRRPARGNSNNSAPSRGRGNSSGGGGRGRGRGNGRKFIQPSADRFIHTGVPLIEVKYDAPTKFSEFPLHEDLMKNIEKLGWEYPTEIQDKTFHQITELKDILGVANTGTGKTGAFLLPIINSMLFAEEDFSALVMVPTRELAEQVEAEFRMFTKGLKLYANCFIGGTSVNQDIQRLRKPFHFVIGTPGRLVDLTKRGALKPEHFSVLILDEFDRMLDMGFSQDVNFLTDKMNDRDQTLLFSATLDRKQESLINNILNEPIRVEVSKGNATAEHIDQDVVYTTRDNKFDTLLEMIQGDKFEKVIIFAETKRRVSDLTQQLRQNRMKVDEIHGDKTQNYRKNALNSFRRGKVDILVATDVAARGLDISDVTHVINYEIPFDYETYIHRIGRTGRAGKKGQAYTFFSKR
ncbi:MAG: DEAD/DEAH box helicase [Weeksellaceae bacterium]